MLARDITDTAAHRTAMVLAPHADDETIGCGATIARKAASATRVLVVIAADGENDVRRAECREACRRLGLANNAVRFLGLPDSALAEHLDELEAAVRELLDEERPAELYVPSRFDAHPDHRALATVVDRLPGHDLHGTTVLAYPVWYWNRWAWVERGTPRWRQRVQLVWRPVAQALRVRTRTVATGEFLGPKRDALAAHRSQVDQAFAGQDGKVLDPKWLDMFFGDDELFFVVRR
jgi:LmbE family N-acetylglucosaminyl deacetylase